MPKKAVKEVKMTREDYEAKITEMEEKIKEDQFLINLVDYRREVLTLLNDIKQNTSSNQAGGEPDEKYLPEVPEPEDEEDF